MKKYIVLFITFYVVFVTKVSAQSQTFLDKTNYIADLKKVLSETKNYNLTNLGNRFEAVYWNHPNLDDINKSKVTFITARLYAKGYNTNTHLVAFLNTTMKALDSKDISHEHLLNYFETLSATIENQDGAVLMAFLQLSSVFFEKHMLYYSFNNSVLIKEGTFDFKYVGASVNNSADSSKQANSVQDILSDSRSVNTSADGPLITVSNATLWLICRFDTLEIRNTNGSLQFSSKLFIGTGGKIDWSSVGSDLKEINIELPEYSFSALTNEITIEKVKFTNPFKLEVPIFGSFQYKKPTTKNPGTTEFPKFISLSNDNVIKNIARNMTYMGAFSLYGRKFVSMCVDNKPSSLVFNDAKRSFQVLSTNFEFVDSLVTAKPAETIIFIGNDSIVHPGLSFSFNAGSLKARFKRDKGPFKSSPFRDTFHGFEFSLDVIDWDLRSDSIDLNILAAKGQIPAVFKSTNYFNDKEFKSLQGIGNVHPLRLIYSYSNLKGNTPDNLYADEICKKMKITNIASFNGTLSELDRKGFLDFSPSSGKIRILPKATHFMLSHIGKSDFDNLYLPSLSPQTPNATIRFNEENVMVIRGVERFFISDSSNVFALPDSGVVKIYQNKEIHFDGYLIAGFFNFKGKKFKFNYNDFLVTLTQIDTIHFQKPKKKKNSVGEKQFMDNQLVYSSGTLYINEPNNKSAKKSNPEYPRFDAVTGAYVYFTGKEILGGTYDRQIYFKIPPFKTDSVHKYDHTNVKFTGNFNSAGMFPEFEEQLKVMPDNSLGFTHKIPKEGYPVFNGKGKFFGTLKLDNGGIQGEGEIHYQSGVFYSNNFIFYQDSVVTQGTQAKIKERADSIGYFPDTDIADYEMKWSPKGDSMHVINIGHPFELYKKQLSLEGALNLSPKGLSGEGLLEIKKERVIAPKIDFNQKNVVARHAVLNSKLPGYTKNSLEVNNVKITFDMKESFADINPEIRGIAGISFPLCEYSTSIENAHWDLTKRTVYMTAEDPNDISKSYFISTNPQYDSLTFNAAEAVYNINKRQLKIDGVPFIKVADSKLIPDSNRVIAYEEGKLRTFKKARLIIDTTNGYHYLVKGKIDIESKYKFSGSAVYKYANIKGDTFFIPFNQFITEEQVLNKKETLRYTASDGEVTEEQKFYIAPHVLYRGKVKLMAPKQSLMFEGSVKITLKSKELRTDWIPYKHDGSTKDFVLQLAQQIPLNKKAKNGDQILSEAGLTDSTLAGPPQVFTGFYYESPNYNLYATLASNKKNEEDEEIFNATGELRYDASVNGFTVGDPKRLNNQSLAGNKYIYNDSTSTITAQGIFKLIRNDINFNLTSAGNVEEIVAKHKFSLKSMLSFKMNAPQKAFDIMSKKLTEASSFSEENIIKDTVSKEEIEANIIKIAQFGGDKAAKSYENAIADMLDYKPLFKYCPKLLEGMAFANVDFGWSNEHNAWYSKGPLKMSNIFNTDINANIKGIIEIKKTDIGDNISIWLSVNPETWFYINYQPGRLSLLSTESDFNLAISSKSKGETGTPAVYTFVVGDEAEQALFVKDFYKNYLGKNYDETEEYKQFQDRKENVTPPENQYKDDSEPDLQLKKEKNKNIKQTEIISEETPAEEPVKKTPKTKKEKKKKVDITSDEQNIEVPQNEETPQESSDGVIEEKKKKKKKIKTTEENEPK